MLNINLSFGVKSFGSLVKIMQYVDLFGHPEFPCSVLCTNLHVISWIRMGLFQKMVDIFVNNS